MKKDTMENDNGSSALKIILYIGGSIVVLFMAIYLVMALLSPGRKIEEIRNEYGYKANDKIKLDENILRDSAFISLNSEKSYYQARGIMAESDSICLALNLADSSATLEISGVAVHKARLSKIIVSKVFRNADEYSLSTMLSTPLSIENDFSTIKKEPMMIKMAPKDTSEYKPDILPDTTRSEPVSYIFEMKGGVRVHICQNADEIEKGRFNIFMFNLSDKFRTLSDNLSRIERLKVPEYHPAIRLRMQKSDARIIYRALPRHGMISILL